MLNLATRAQSDKPLHNVSTMRERYHVYHVFVIIGNQHSGSVAPGMPFGLG